jgi:CrcB protein
MIQALLVGLGGFLGAISRYFISKQTSELFGSFPTGTLLVNVTGSFMLGFLLYSAMNSRMISPEFRLLVGVGFIGAYTTMSTFAYESFRLVELKDYLYAGLNIALNIILCLIAIYLGKVASGLVTSLIKGN